MTHTGDSRREPKRTSVMLRCGPIHGTALGVAWGSCNLSPMNRRGSGNRVFMAPEYGHWSLVPGSPEDLCLSEQLPISPTSSVLVASPEASLTWRKSRAFVSEDAAVPCQLHWHCVSMGLKPSPHLACTAMCSGPLGTSLYSCTTCQTDYLANH